MATVAKLHLLPLHCHHKAGHLPPSRQLPHRRFSWDPILVTGRGRCRSFRSEEGNNGEQGCYQRKNIGSLKSVRKLANAFRNAVWRASKPSLRSDREPLEKLEEALFSLSMYIGRYIVTMLSTGVILLIGFQLSGGDGQMNELIWYSWLGGIIIGTMIGSNMVLDEVSRSGPRNVVITGSTRGLGKALAREFLLSGDRVIVTSRSRESVDTTIKELAENLKQVMISTGGSSRKCLRHARVAGIPCDVSNPEDVRKLANFALNEFGSVDIWVNNAGTNKGFRPLLQFNDDDIQQVESVIAYSAMRALYSMNTYSQLDPIF